MNNKFKIPLQPRVFTSPQSAQKEKEKRKEKIW